MAHFSKVLLWGILTITIDLHGTDPFYGREEILPFLPLPSYSPPIFHHLSIILFEIIKNGYDHSFSHARRGNYFLDLKQCCVWFFKSKSIQVFRPKLFKMAMIHWCTNILLQALSPLYCLLTLTVLLSKSLVTPHWPSYIRTLKQVWEKETKEENNIFLNVTI